ncbi:MAG: N-acyl-D-amino-acid deacylase family protein [Ilumatobacter sp.]|uniref:N-acyl-D-amino-acid deacylase family protein n=1 Tax=Ilumatobacter sp. TaxID=1967498 RepID=UPI00391B33FD
MPNESLVIRGGLVFDGTGAAPVARDVLVTDGVISVVEEQIGDVDAREIRADGCWVLPGFIDPHTHLDAQLFWDPSGQPSVLHGVTTVITGNCGFGIAPCGDGAEEYLLRCLEAVEEIPYESTRQAVPFGWSDFSSYLDALGDLDLGVNVAALVPHSPLRHSVMGERAWTEPATPDDLAAMKQQLTAALAAGAVGFATSRGPNHVDGSGQPVPSRLADDDELRALVEACADRIWQINIQSKADPTGDASLAEVAKYVSWSEEFGADFSWTPLLITPGDTVVWRRLVDQASEFEQRGGRRVLPQVSPLPLVSSIEFSGRSFAESITGWSPAVRRLDGLDAAQRLELIADESFRRVLRDTPEDCGAMLSPCFDRWVLAASSTRPELVGKSLREVGDALQTHPIDAFCDLAISDRLETVVQVPLVNLEPGQVAEAVGASSTLIGLGDAGAHVSSITNYTYPTFLLASAARGELAMSTEQAVHELTGKPAALFGLEDRGVIAPSAPADLVVVDPERVALQPSRRVVDLPGGSARLLQEAQGYRAVIVGGVVVVDDDKPVGVKAGRVLRRASAVQ